MDSSNDVMRDLAARALPAWGLGAARIELVSVSENVVFRVDADDGRRFALRLHRPGYHTLAELESEPLWTTALRAAGIGAPQAERTPFGAYYVLARGVSESRHAGLVRWFDGISLDRRIEQAGDASVRDSYFEQLGRLMAAMHDQAVGWEPPTGFRRHSFDVDGLMGEAPFWGRFWEIPQLTDTQADTLSRVRRVIAERLRDYGLGPGTYSMIHADLRSANVLVNGDQVQVIDFDDAGFGWHQYDMAVALFDHSAEPDFDRIRGALVSGYRSRRFISDEDLDLLPLFLLIRSLVALGWLNDRPEVELYALLPALIEHACAGAEALLAADG